MDENVKNAVIDNLIRRTRMVVEGVYYEIMMGIQPDLDKVLPDSPDNADADNVTDYMLHYCSEVLVHTIIKEKSVSMQEGAYISMLVYPMLTGDDVAEKAAEMIPEDHLQWLAEKYELTYEGKRLAK
jgi:hypothetical protein